MRTAKDLKSGTLVRRVSAAVGALCAAAGGVDRLRGGRARLVRRAGVRPAGTFQACSSPTAFPEITSPHVRPA